MKITGPDNYKIKILPPEEGKKFPTKFEIISPESDGKVHGRAAEGKRPKLYVISQSWRLSLDL